MVRLILVGVLFAITVPLAAQTGFADVRSTPDSAFVTIDDVPRGITPLLVTLSVGTHRISAMGRDGSTQTVILEVREDEVSRCLISLPPHWSYRQIVGSSPHATDGRLTVLTLPAGADVAIDGRATGVTTPATIADVPPGRRIVRVSRFLDRLQDRFSVAETVEVRTGAASIVRIDFEANTIEGRLRLVSNAPRIAVTLRHEASGKRYHLRQTGEVRLVTGVYSIERPDTTSIPIPGIPVVVMADSLTELTLPVWSPLRPVKKLTDHPSYVPWETFLRRSYKPRPLSETRTELTVSGSFAWWLAGGTSLLLAGQVTDADVASGRAASNEAGSSFRLIGVAALVAGAVVCSDLDTVHVDLSFNQQANAKEEEFLAARYAEIVSGWQQQVDGDNKAIEADNRKRTAANAALPLPTVRMLPQPE